MKKISRRGKKELMRQYSLSNWFECVATELRKHNRIVFGFLPLIEAHRDELTEQEYNGLIDEEYVRREALMHILNLRYYSRTERARRLVEYHCINAAFDAALSRLRAREDQLKEHPLFRALMRELPSTTQIET